MGCGEDKIVWTIAIRKAVDWINLIKFIYIKKFQAVLYFLEYRATRFSRLYGSISELDFCISAHDPAQINLVLPEVDQLVHYLYLMIIIELPSKKCLQKRN